MRGEVRKLCAEVDGIKGPIPLMVAPAQALTIPHRSSYEPLSLPLAAHLPTQCRYKAVLVKSNTSLTMRGNIISNPFYSMNHTI